MCEPVVSASWPAPARGVPTPGLSAARLTTRLRSKVSAAVTATNRAMSEVAKDYGVAWWTVHRILVATAVEALGQAAPTSMIGIDETRARSVRWFFKETSWARSDPWMTSIVDLDPSHPGGIIGLAPGRSGARSCRVRDASRRRFVTFVTSPLAQRPCGRRQ